MVATYNITFKRELYEYIRQKFKPTDTMDTLVHAVRGPMDACHRSANGARGQQAPAPDVRQDQFQYIRPARLRPRDTLGLMRAPP